MRIAVSGKSGCGNTTVSTLLAERLGYPMINFTFRQMAKERNMDFWDFCALANRDDSIDKELDSRQVQMAMAEKDCVLGSRLAIWMLKEADFKVYLEASDEAVPTRSASIPRCRHSQGPMTIPRPCRTNSLSGIQRFLSW